MLKKFACILTSVCIVLVQIALPFPFLGTTASAVSTTDLGTHVCSGKYGANVTYSMWVKTYSRLTPSEEIPRGSVTGKDGNYYKFKLIISGTGPMEDARGGVSPWLDETVTMGCNNQLGTIPYGIDVIIEDGVTTIGDYAFYGNGYANPFENTNSRYSSVSISSTVQSIGRYAFKDCQRIYTIELPSSVTTINQGAFENTSFQNLSTSAEMINSTAFKDARIGNLTYNGSAVPAEIFNKTKALLSVTLGSNVKSVGTRAFAGCTELTSVTLGSNVETIGTGAFENCSELSTAELPNGITTINPRVFYGCEKLGITIPSSVTAIGDSAFYSCSSKFYKGVDISCADNLVTVGDNAFYGCRMSGDVKIPDSVTTIGNNAFNNEGSYYKITSIIIGENSRLETIGDGAFWGNSINKIEFPAGIKSLGNKIFDGIGLIPYGDDGNAQLLENDPFDRIALKYTISDGKAYINEIKYFYQSINPRVVKVDGGDVFGYPIAFVDKNYRKNVITCDSHALQSFDADGECVICGYKCYHKNTEWTQENDMHREICQNCGKVITAGNCTGGTATCKNKAVCTVCGNEYGDIADHTEKIITPEIPATCESDGFTKHAVCSVCDITLTEREIIPALGHSFTNYISNGNDTKTAHCNRKGCDATDTVADGAAECAIKGHIFKDYFLNYDADCINDGTKTAKCERCGATDTVTVEGSKWGHSFKNYKSNNDATCTEDGTKTARCERCFVTDTVTDIDSKLGHKFIYYEINNDATCTEDGTRTVKCARCGVMDTIPNVGSAKGHSFTNYTSNNDGTKTAHCDRAGCDATDTIEDNSYECTIKGHSFTNYVWNCDSSCTQDGTKTAKCDRCDATDTVTVEGTKWEHTFRSYVSNHDATCTEDGTKTARCYNCGTANTVPDVGSKLGHSFTNYVSNNDATCTEYGTETAKCDRCSVTDTRIDMSSKHNPKWVQENGMHWQVCSRCGEELIAPENCSGGKATCKYKAVCKVCGKAYGDVAHTNLRVWDGKPATCEADGYTEAAVCYDCSTMIKNREKIPALGHSFTNYVSNGDATKTAHCDREGCDATDTIADGDSECAIKGHSFTKYVSNGDATCTEDGTKTAKCDRCNATDTISDTGSKGHSFTNYVPNNDATCTKDGTKTGVCTLCGKSETVPDVGSAKGHSFTKYVHNDDATCQSNGTGTAKCDRCDVTDTMAFIALPSGAVRRHDMQYTSNNDATCTKDGTKTGVCTHCGKSETVPDVGSAKGHRFGNNWKSDSDNHWHECECGEKSEIAGHIPNEGTTDPETGRKIFRCTVCGVVTREESSYLLGDVNGDGKINNTDIILLGRAYMSGNGNNYLAVADMNKDGQINNADIILLGRYYMGMKQ